MVDQELDEIEVRRMHVLSSNVTAAIRKLDRCTREWAKAALYRIRLEERTVDSDIVRTALAAEHNALAFVVQRQKELHNEILLAAQEEKDVHSGTD